jgi:Resolvase, N terminal domain
MESNHGEFRRHLRSRQRGGINADWRRRICYRYFVIAAGACVPFYHVPCMAGLRVSSSEQGRSGLGLAAQRHDIENFGSREAFTIQSWHLDVQTGAGKDALLLRPGLAEALKGARASRCPLIVSRLDRLSRNVH